MKKIFRKKSRRFGITTIIIIGIFLVGGILLYKNYQCFSNNTLDDASRAGIKSNKDISVNNATVPYRDPKVEDFQIDANSAISVVIDDNGNEKVLFEKDPDEKLLIASITKLMTAAVVLDNYDFSQKVKISRMAVHMGGLLNVGDTFTVDTLFHIILIASDNTAAYTFSEMMPKGKFVELMNLKAKEFGLTNTYYSNSVGFGLENHSTANDLVKLSYQLLKKYPLIFKTSYTDEYDIYDVGGGFHYKTANTNKLLAENEVVKYEDRIIGGKLGENNIAGGCLVLVLKAPNNNGYIINVILNSKYRFTEMSELVDWVDTAYKW